MNDDSDVDDSRANGFGLFAIGGRCRFLSQRAASIDDVPPLAGVIESSTLLYVCRLYTIHNYVYVYAFVSANAYVNVYVDVDVYVYVFVNVYVCVYVYVNVVVNVYVYVNINIYMHICLYVYPKTQR